MSFTALVDEHDRPSMRETLGVLLRRARTADIAITHMRLAGLDLRTAEIGSIERCRVMLGHLDAGVLLDDDWPPGQLNVLAAFARSGRLEMRTAPHHSWNPDFSVFGLPDDSATALLGAHYFGRPYPRFGLAFTCITTQRGPVLACRRRFEELWQAGYDVLPVVSETLSRLIDQQ